VRLFNDTWSLATTARIARPPGRTAPATRSSIRQQERQLGRTTFASRIRARCTTARGALVFIGNQSAFLPAGVDRSRLTPSRNERVNPLGPVATVCRRWRARAIRCSRLAPSDSEFDLGQDRTPARRCTAARFTWRAAERAGPVRRDHCGAIPARSCREASSSVPQGAQLHRASGTSRDYARKPRAGRCFSTRSG